jgi:DNA repair exonuclease SbcCD ATPase subunit
MKITAVTIKNFKGVRYARVVAHPHMNEIAGKNGAGKSSVLDAPFAALCGKRAVDPKPLMIGELKGEITVELGDIVVTRRLKEDGGSELKIKAAAGKMGQRDLDALIGEFTFDPLRFSMMKPAEQMLALQQLAGPEWCSQLAKLDSDIETLTSKRKDVKQELQRYGVIPQQLRPCDRVDLQDVMEMISSAEVQNHRADVISSDLRSLATRLVDMDQRILSLETQLANAKSQRVEMWKAREELELEASHLTPIDVSALKEKFQKAADINAANDRYEANERARAQQRAAASSLETLEEQISAKRDERTKLLREAPLPIEGLAWSKDGVTVNGVPFEQECFSKRLRIGAYIGHAVSGQLKVMFLREYGAELDDDSFKELERFAVENDCQFWVETVGKGHSGEALIIEDGILVDSEEAI